MRRNYFYDTWGQGTGGSDPGGFAGADRARWKGALWLGPEVELYYMRARWYEPKSGRFLSEDPIGLAGGINGYSYAGDDPVNQRDPLGLRCEVLQQRFVDGEWVTVSTREASEGEVVSGLDGYPIRCVGGNWEPLQGEPSVWNGPSEGQTRVVSAPQRASYGQCLKDKVNALGFLGKVIAVTVAAEATRAVVAVGRNVSLLNNRIIYLGRGATGWLTLQRLVTASTIVGDAFTAGAIPAAGFPTGLTTGGAVAATEGMAAGVVGATVAGGLLAGYTIGTLGLCAYETITGSGGS